VPLAPGYRIVKETREVESVPGQPGKIEIHSRRTLQNNGTANLAFIDIEFPGEKSFGRKNLRARWDGHQATLSMLPGEEQPDHPNTLRIAFDSPWTRGRTHDLTIEYELSSPEDSGSRITIGESDFHLGSLGWISLLQPPGHFLADYPKRPDKTDYSIRAPADFLMLARGKMLGRKRAGNEIEYRFRLRAKDLAAFVVGGSYKEQAFHRGSGTVVFWTLEPLQSDPGATSERITNAWATLENDFGVLDPDIHVPHIVESPELRGHIAGESGPAAASFPGGALVNRELLALGIASEAFVEHVTHALAHNWFGDEMYPTSEAAIAMGEGLPDYATIVIDEARSGPETRRRRILDYLRRYQEASSRAAETPLGDTVLTDHSEQRNIALAKAPLMYAALEDRCGEAPVRNGLKHLVTLLRGQEVGINDMRSAIEHTCGKDLGEFFRVWLYAKGLPEDFRARYETSASAGN
jgi:Peptidase family M1 domain